ncbi:MAG: GDP-mannose 4,6-dehydratase [Planctomycetes bacterium]|nr:GDP-mannose 4,6-dehydratase [Planctomycetota bacterium]
MPFQRLLVTGATGFIGPYLLRELVGRAAVIVGLTSGRVSPRRPARALEGELAGRVHLLSCDLTDKEAVLDLVRSLMPDAVVHAAAQASIPASYRDPDFTFRVNVDGTRHLYDALMRAEIRPRVLFIGSADVYGSVSEDENPIGERAEFRPLSPYAVSKAAADLLSYQVWKNYGLPVIRLRPFNHAGAGQGTGFVIPDFACQVAEIEVGRRAPEIMVGDLSAKRDFTNVRDMARAYALALDACAPGEVYNIGSGVAESVAQVLDLLLGLATTPIRKKVDPSRLRPSDAPLRLCDPGKFRAATGWAPQRTIAQTVEEVLNDWRARLAATTPV